MDIQNDVDMLSENVPIVEDVNSIRSQTSRRKDLFNKINYMTLGAESDYKELFSHKVYQLYKQIDDKLTELANYMSEEVSFDDTE